MKQLRIALLGQGRSGRDIHGEFFLKDLSGQYKVVAVVDAIKERRERAQQEFGCDTYADYRQILRRSDIDLVVNAFYSYLHYPVTLDLIEHGFSVVVEKPFGRYRADCQKLIQKAEEKGVMVNVFQQSRFAPYYTAMKAILASGKLGEIKQISLQFSGFSRRWDWQCSQRFWGGSLLNTGPHPMDQALDLLDFDEKTQVIYSKLDTVNTFGDAEDYCKILLTAPGKPLIDVEISSCNAYADFTYRIQAQYGSLNADLHKIQYKYFDPSEAPKQKLILTSLMGEQGRPQYCSEKLPWKEEEIILEGSAFDVGTRRYYQMIYDYLTEKKPMQINARQVLQQIQLDEKIHSDNPLPMWY